MCRTCGCSDDAQPTLTDLQTGAKVPLALDREQGDHDHDLGRLHLPGDDGLQAAVLGYQSHRHDHHHEHSHAQDHYHAPDGSIVPLQNGSKRIRLEQDLLAKSRLLAERNRGWLAGREILALNLISSPGAGKTTLLERTIRDLDGELPISVIEGDQATLHDAQRIQATGCKVVQINTGAGCHLEADMTARGLQQLDPPLHSVVLIENVGNLVCPALFDLGEHAKVVVMAVTDGEDKPVKYPHAFRGSEVMILNKIDLLPYVRFDVDRCLDFARQINPRLRVFQISATRGDGLADWYGWLREQQSIKAASQFASLIQLP
jgi:hydrogenase nickel incorporation protein HypB